MSVREESSRDSESYRSALAFIKEEKDGALRIDPYYKDRSKLRAYLIQLKLAYKL
jgi:hypothetical protein